MWHPPTFSLQNEHLFFRGDFIFRTVGRAWVALHAMVKEIDAHVVTVDLSQVQRVDSAGLALLLALLREGMQRGKSLHFVHIPDKMHALAVVAGVEDILFNHI